MFSTFSALLECIQSNTCTGRCGNFGDWGVAVIGRCGSLGDRGVTGRYGNLDDWGEVDIRDMVFALAF